MVGKIAEYDSPVNTFRPSEAGASAWAQAGRRLGSFFNQAAEQTASVGAELGQATRIAGDTAVAYLDHQQISAGAKNAAELTDALTSKWNDVAKNADPNDPSVASKFRDEMLEPALEKFKGAFYTEKGQQWAETHADALRNHFYRKTAADMTSLAGKAASENATILGNKLTNAAVSDPTFSNVDFLMGQTKGSIEGIISANPNLKGVASATLRTGITLKVQEAIVKGAALSAIAKSDNPEKTAADWTSRYPGLINGSEALSFAKHAASVAKMNRAYERQTQVAEKQLQVENGRKFVGQAIGSFINDDGTINPTAQANVMKELKAATDPSSPNYNPGVATHAEALFKFAQSEGKAVDNPTVLTGLQDRLFDRADPLQPEDIIKAANANGISHATAGILEGQRKLIEEHGVNAPGVKAVLAAAKASLVVPTNYSDFMQDFTNRYLRAKATNELKPGDLNFSDPNSLVSKALADHQPDNATKMQYKVLQSIGQGLGDINEQTKMLNAPSVGGMSIPDAVAKYGPGAWVKNSKGDLVKLPMK